MSLNKALAAYTPDPHELPVSQDADADLLADAEELAIGYRPFNPDQNRNQIPDGVDLAKRCSEVINQLPFGPDPTDPNKTYIEHWSQWGLERCDICGAIVNMGPAWIVNPKLVLRVDCPLIAMHYIEHGSFSFAGDVHRGRVDVPALGRALELCLPFEPDEHQMPVADDADEDLLANAEEYAIGYRPFDPDQNSNEIPDGVELAKRCVTVVKELPQKHEAEPGETYKIEHALDGLEQCDICGRWIHMGGWEIVNPKLVLRYPDSNDPLDGMFLPDLALHYMEHGSFDCYGDYHQGRVDIARLIRVLAMRFPYDPNEHQLPLDYVVKGVGQLAPDANDLDGDLLADSEELAAGYNLYDPDQDEDLTPDGIELAEQCSQVIDGLPVYDPRTDMPIPSETYKINFFQKGLELCEICGQSVNMGYWRIVNPKLERSIDVYDITCHYMSHGSFSYSGLQISPPHEPFHNGRINIKALADILEMPRRCGHLGTIYLPADLDKNCKVNFKDVAKFADRWLDSTEPNQNGSDKP